MQRVLFEADTRTLVGTYQLESTLINENCETAQLYIGSVWRPRHQLVRRKAPATVIRLRDDGVLRGFGT